MIPIMHAYSPLLLKLHEIDTRRHTEVMGVYQGAMGAIFKKELADVIDNLKSGRMVRARSSEDRSYCKIATACTLARLQCSSFRSTTVFTTQAHGGGGGGERLLNFPASMASGVMGGGHRKENWVAVSGKF